MDLSPLRDISIHGVEAVLLYKLLGPTSDYLGGRTKELTEKAYNNVGNILQKAIKKLGDGIDRPGEVPPRVLRGVINEGAFCEDEIAAEYFAGVLASSRSEGSRDDRGVVINALLSRLSVYQIRTHYIIYWIFKDLFQGRDFKWEHLVEEWNGISIPNMHYMLAMDFLSNEMKLIKENEDHLQIFTIINQTFDGLYQEGLISRYSWVYGEDGDIQVSVSQRGIELFLWANGYGNLPNSSLLDPNVAVLEIEGIHLSREGITIASDDGTSIEKIRPYNYADPDIHRKSK